MRSSIDAIYAILSQICFVTLYAICTIFSPFTHFLCGKKLSPNFCPLRKMANIMYDMILESYIVNGYLTWQAPFHHTPPQNLCPQPLSSSYPWWCAPGLKLVRFMFSKLNFEEAEKRTPRTWSTVALLFPYCPEVQGRWTSKVWKQGIHQRTETANQIKFDLTKKCWTNKTMQQ